MEKIKQKYLKKPIKGDIYNLGSLKIILDDLLLEYLTKAKQYKHRTFLVDFRIFVGILSTVVACAIAYLSVNFEFEEYKNKLIIGLIIYFGANAFVWGVEKMQKTTFRFDNVSVTTNVQPPSPVYTVMVYEGNKLIPEKYSKSIFEMFTTEGVLLHEILLKDFETLFN